MATLRIFQKTILEEQIYSLEDVYSSDADFIEGIIFDDETDDSNVFEEMEEWPIIEDDMKENSIESAFVFEVTLLSNEV